MNILIISSYPPVIDCEANHAYYLARHLGEKMHQVFVVSDCQEKLLSSKFRLNCENLDILQPPNVKLYSTNPFAQFLVKNEYNPVIEKLTSLALEIISIEKIDVVVGCGVMPYGIVAYNVSRINGLDFCLYSSFSDIKDIQKASYLYMFLNEVLSYTNAIIAPAAAKCALEELGYKKVFSSEESIKKYFDNKTNPLTKGINVDKNHAISGENLKKHFNNIENILLNR